MQCYVVVTVDDAPILSRRIADPTELPELVGRHSVHWPYSRVAGSVHDENGRLVARLVHYPPEQRYPF